MVKPRERKTNRGQASNKIFDNALDMMKNENVSLRKAAAHFELCHVSLYRYKKQLDKHNIPPKIGYRAHNKVFTKNMENELVNYCQTAAKLYFGVSTKEFRKLALEYAKVNKLKYPDGWDEAGLASKDWLIAFLRRNPSLSIRTPESTSLARAMNFNKVNVGKFYDNLASVMDRYSFEPHNIYNVDETCVNTVQNPSKVIALKGTKQVGGLTSQERGNSITMCLAISAVGHAIPPTFVFPRVNFHHHFIRDGPVGCDGTGNKSGWMQEGDFTFFIKHFAKYAKPSETSRVLLLLDNHSSHLSIEVIDFCRDNFITLLSFPPHTTHKLQPLDRTVYGPFKKYFNTFADQWIRNNPGKRMTIYDLPGIVAQALPQAANPSNIISGFKCTGIYPFNREIFGNDEYEPASVTDIPLNNDMSLSSVSTDATPANLENIPSLNATLSSPVTLSKPDESINKQTPHFETANTGENTEISNLEPQASCSGIHISNYNISPKDKQNPTVSPLMIRPLPKVTQPIVTTSKRAKGKTAILTDTPEKENILSLKQKIKKKPKLNMGQGQSKRKGKGKGKSSDKSNKRKQVTKVIEDEGESEDELCLVCMEPYSLSKEDWLKCTVCNFWAHETCAQCKYLNYICINCVDSESD